MNYSVFECKSLFHCSVETLFDFHESPKGFQTLVGQDSSVQVIQAPASIRKGSIAILQVNLFPGIATRWVSEHTVYEKNLKFVDEQRQGPFLYFKHEHRFSSAEHNKSILTDHIEFSFPLLLFSRFFIAGRMNKQFLQRHKSTAEALSIEWKNLGSGII
jgi:ligand-binding SRPBCC domain-containing protein